MRHHLPVLALLFAACSTGGSGHPDLAGRDLTPNFNFDLSGPDLSEPPDLAEPPDLTPPSFCPGTMVANTCAATFFAPIAGCFVKAGQCVAETDQMSYENACWSNGSKLLISNLNMMAMTATVDWWGAFKHCITADFAVANGESRFHLHLNGQTLDYNLTTGAVTCPDGTMTNIGPNGSDCAQVKVYFEPPFTNCGMGACM
jgi:hypothetical protein